MVNQVNCIALAPKTDFELLILSGLGNHKKLITYSKFLEFVSATVRVLTNNTSESIKVEACIRDHQYVDW